MSEFTLEQLTLAVEEAAKLGSESGQEVLRRDLADYFDRLASKECFEPDFNAIASDIRSGKIANRAETPDLMLIDLTDEKVRTAYRLGLGNIQVEIRNAVARENLRCQTLLKLARNQWSRVGLGVRAGFVDELRDMIAPVSE